MPYITRLHVEDCRNVKLLDIDLSVPESTGEEAPASTPQEQRSFRHLILTGPNGSGKSGVLKALARRVSDMIAPPEHKLEFDPSRGHQRLVRIGPQPDGTEEHLGVTQVQWSCPWRQIQGAFSAGDMISAYSGAQRGLKQMNVAGPAALQSVDQPLAPFRRMSEQLLQFLVNRYTGIAFATAEGNEESATRLKSWFNDLERLFQDLMDDRALTMRFDHRSFKIRFRRSDGYEFDLNTLADGHAAAMSLIGEILIRMDAAREIKGDHMFDPSGVVIVDEIETHLHLSLQEQILPLLTTMFPRVQFIVATHSPAVIASIPGAVVYDLRKQQQFLSDQYRGIPYGMLMTRHFGISSDIDLDSTKKLLRFRELARIASRTPEEAHEMQALAEELSARSAVLATEVWMVKEHIRASEIQLAGE